MPDISALIPGIVPLDEFAAAIGKTTRTLRNWEASGFPIIRRGRSRFVDLAKAGAYLRGESSKPRRGRRPRKIEVATEHAA